MYTFTPADRARAMQNRSAGHTTRVLAAIRKLTVEGWDATLLDISDRTGIDRAPLSGILTSLTRRKIVLRVAPGVYRSAGMSVQDALVESGRMVVRA